MRDGLTDYIRAKINDALFGSSPNPELFGSFRGVHGVIFDAIRIRPDFEASIVSLEFVRKGEAVWCKHFPMLLTGDTLQLASGIGIIPTKIT